MSFPTELNSSTYAKAVEPFDPVLPPLRARTYHASHMTFNPRRRRRTAGFGPRARMLAI